MPRRLLHRVITLVLLPAAAAWGADNVAFKHEGKTLRISGRVVQEAGGGVLLLAPDGVLWNIEPDNLLEHKTDERPFKPLSREEFAKKLLAEMPPGSKVHNTAHYLICYNTSDAYAQWCGALYERLYKAYRGYWKNRNWELSEPEFPLVALVFDDKDSYAEYARKEIGAGAEAIVAYYNFGKNRVVMFDLTGADALGGKHGGKRAKVNDILSKPEAQYLVATIIHEATHQLSFNCGLHQRYADIPLWVSEGTAIYFETPDLKGAGDGWTTIGVLSRPRLQKFLLTLKERPDNALARLLTDDQRFKDPKTAADCYAEAWAFNYYLFQKKKDDYVAYLKMLSEKKPGIIDEPNDRLAAFKSIFGDNLKKLDDDFVKFMRSRK